MRVVLCCLYDEKVVGSRDNPVFERYNEAHDETAESALFTGLRSVSTG